MVILCGGLGRRLRPVIGERQKVVADVMERPFLGTLVDYFIQEGFRRFIFCTGFGSDEVRTFIEKEYGAEENLHVIFSEEAEPLGTGGAIRNALSHVTGEDFFAANGDTFCEVDFGEMYDFHKRNRASLSIALVASNREDGGSAALDHNGKILSFKEKQKRGVPCLINGGVYVFSRDAFEKMQSQKFSLEIDLFPEIVGEGRAFGFFSDGGMLDIGTPERYASAENFFERRAQ